MQKISNMRRAAYDVSVILPFSDDEEVIGRACRRIARHLRQLGARFELLAVDEDSGDNSHAVLALVRGEVPELKVLVVDDAERGFAEGARQARGRVLWLVTPRAGISPLAPFARAWRHVLSGACDVAVVHGRFAVCHRTRCLPVVESLRGGEGFMRRLAKRASARRLEVEIHRPESAASALPATAQARSEGRFTRFLEALGFAPSR
jgi:hypothetical protein